MTNETVLSVYLDGLAGVLPAGPAAKSARDREAAKPLSPYASDQLADLEQFLLQSTALQQELWAQWQAAESARERSIAEVQLLGAAAADLAIAERLAYSAGELEGGSKRKARSAMTRQHDATIRQALSDPASLLAPAKLPPPRRGGDFSREGQQLVDAAKLCLNDVRTSAAAATKDTLGSLLSMKYAIVKEAAEMLGADLSEALAGTSGGFMKTAVDYIVSAIAKIRLLVGPDGEQEIKEAIADFVKQLQDETFVAEQVGKFLNTGDIYEESKVWVKAFEVEGDKAVLTSTALEIAQLQGSFAGRVKVADTVVRGLAVIKLLPPLAAPPWGPLAVAAAYLGVSGYILFSAHDHVDSDKYKVLDRVRGVRGTIQAKLVVPEAPAGSETEN